MDFGEFERAAIATWADIPEQYKHGVDGLIVDRAAKSHDEDPEIYTLGECVTEEYPSQYGGPDTTRSAVVLYYGSFRQIAQEDEDFDWQAEIDETIRHELQHHLESLATESTLEDFDYAVDENFKRVRGELFDPLFYRAGEPYEAVTGVAAVNADRAADITKVARAAIESWTACAVEADVFVEITTRERAAMMLEWSVDAVTYRAALAAAGADVTYYYIDDGLDVDVADFCIVRIIRRSVLATLRSAFGSGYSLGEVTASAERIA